MLPLFLPDGAATRLRVLKQQHSDELQTLLEPLNTLSPSERIAVGAASIAAGAGRAWEANELVLDRLLPPSVACTMALPAPGVSDSMAPPSPPATEQSYDSAAQLLAHLARDWSAAGAAARRKTHRPVLRALRRVQRRRRPLRVLVPGAGACRLAWEIARRGHRVEANDESVGMMVAAHSLIARVMPRRDSLTLVPRVRCEAGALSRGPCLEAASVPDAATAAVPANLTLQVADFGGFYAEQRGRWDVLVTSYFLDTLADPAAAVRRAWELLAPDGVWINVGPLHWHQPKLGLLRLSWEELRALLQLSGFRLRESRVIRGVPYLGRRRRRAGVLSGAESWHDALFFVARKELKEADRTQGSTSERPTTG